MNKINIGKMISRISLILLFLMGTHTAFAQNSDYKVRQAKTYLNSGNFKAALPLMQEAAKAGNAEGQYWAGRMYYSGAGVTKDITIAMKMLNLSKNAGYIDAFLFLADIAYEENKSEEAFTLLKQASDKGNIRGKYRLGRAYLYGWGTAKDAESAFFLFREAAIGGDYDAMVSLAQCYMSGKGVSTNDEEAFKWISKASEEGKLCNATYLLGDFYRTGIGIKADQEKAFQCYKKVIDGCTGKAAAQAAERIGYYYQYGGAGVEIDGIEAMSYYKKALQEGITDLETYINMGALYEDGVGVSQNYEKALEYYSKFIGLGEMPIDGHEYSNDYAAGLVADFYYDGKGVTQDYSKAFQYYSRLEHEEAINIEPSHRNAWLLANTAYGLARCYQYGQGTDIDMEKARKYYELAEKYGSDDAKKVLLAFEKENWKKEMIERQLFTFCDLALYYYDENKGNDYAKAFKLFECASEENEPIGLTYVAICYTMGHGIEKDEKEGFKLMLKAAENNEPIAQGLVGQQYFNGTGVSKSIKLAKYWTRKSMEAGCEVGKKLYPAYSQYVEIGDEHLGGVVYRVDATGKHGSVVSKKYTKGGQARCRTWANGYCEAGNCNWRLPSISDYREINSVRHRIKLGVFENSWYWSNDIVGPSSTQGYVFGWQGSRKSNIQQASEYPAVAVSDF